MKKLLSLVPWVVLAACSAESGPTPDPASTDAPSVGDGRIQVGLRLGDTGPAVQQLHARLTNLGYFPSAALREKHADWMPVVPREPAAADRFDEVTQRGVREYQARAGISLSGVVDEATAKALSAQGCGFPEFGSRDESSKWAHFPESWTKTALSWQLVGALPTGLDEAEFAEPMNAAFREWQDHSPFTFTRVAPNQQADIKVFFGRLCCSTGEEPEEPSIAEAETDKDSPTTVFNGRINFRSTVNWGTPNGSNYKNLQSTALHEIGHILGLHHSDPPSPEGNCSAPGNCPEGPIMWYWDNSATSLRDDDNIAIHAKYPGYVKPGRQARFVTAGGDLSVWTLGTNLIAKGYPISKWTPARGWENVSSQGAISLAVESNGVAWAVDNTGQTYITTIFGWWPLGSPQYSVVAAGTDKIWALGKTRDANFEADVYQWDDGVSNFVLVSGYKAASVAVDTRGRAWILRRNRDVYRRDGSTWTKIPKPAPVGAGNIKAGANGAIFVNASESPGWATYIWNKNEGFTATRPEDAHIKIEAREQWLRVPNPPGTWSTFETTSSKDGRFWSITASNGELNTLFSSVR